MNLMSIIVNLLKPFDRRKKIDSARLHDIILPQLIPEILIIEDSTYRTFTRREMELAAKLTNPIAQYVDEYFDCDDFAHIERSGVIRKCVGCPFGVVFVHYENDDGEGVSHALNFFIDENERLWFHEPQTGTTFAKPVGWSATFALI